jgi:GAF domain-containing protein
VAGRTLAALTLATSESDRRFTSEDVAFAEELARRAALAMENARLYRAVQREGEEHRQAVEALRDLNDHLEQRVRERTAGSRRSRRSSTRSPPRSPTT